jgi:glycosyltransferase involved in cell wall biosynthesis
LVIVQGPAIAGFLGIRYGHKYGKKTLFYTHILPWELFAKFFPFPFNHLFYQLIKWISVHYYNLCDEVLVPYHALKEQLENEGVQAKVTVARLGVDIEKYCPSKDRWASKRKVGLEPEKMVIGYVGRVSKEKNVKALLEAFRKLPNQKDLFLLIVGDGPQEQVQNFKEVKNCLVTGFVYNVEDYLQAMDLFVLPSLTETTSLATLEAMSTGLPVIATKIGFIQNYIVKNYNGMFFPRNNPALLATKIELLIKNRELREKLGQNARKTVAYSFSWERSINKIKRILLEQHYQE